MSARADIMAGRSYVSLWVKSDAFTKGLQAARKNLQQFGADIQAVGRQMVAMSAAVILPTAAAVRQFAKFDDAMRAVGAVSRASEKDLALMTDVAKELGRTTSFTAVEVANLMTELGRAGFSPDQINAMTGAVLNLARATGTDAVNSSGIMAASIRQFNLQAGDATRVADAFTSAANGAFVSVDQLGESLSYAGPIANDFQISLEDALAVLGGLGNAGIQGSMAGTALRRLLLITGSEAQKLQGIFGVAMTDAAGNARPLVDTLTEIQKATAGLGTAAKAAKFEEAFGDLGITAASVIGKNGQSIRDLADAIKSTGNVASDTAKKMDAGLGGSFRIILSAAEGVALAIGGALEPSLKSVVDMGTQVLGVVTKWVEKNKSAVVTSIKWAAAIGGIGAALIGLGLAASVVSIAVGGLLAVVAAVKFAFAGLAAVVGLAFAVMTSPVTLIAVALAGIVAAVLQYTGALDVLVQKGIEIRDRLGTAFGDIATTARDTFAGIGEAIMSGNVAAAGDIALMGLQIAFLQGMQAISDIVGGTMGAILSTVVSQIAEGDLAGAWNTIVLSMAAVWDSFTGSIVTAFAGAASFIVNAWRDTIDKMANMILEFAGQGGAFGALFEAISGVDVAAEIERANKLRAASQAAGLSTENSSADALISGTVKSDAAGAIADTINTIAKNAVEDASRKSASSAGELANATAGGGSAVNDQIKNLQLDIAARRRLIAESVKAGEVKPSASATGGTEGSANPAGTGTGAGSASAASFSARSALLSNLGAGTENPMVREIREQKKSAERGTKEQLTKMDTMIMKLDNLGMWHA